jgi:hypothetical protein
VGSSQRGVLGEDASGEQGRVVLHFDQLE